MGGVDGEAGGVVVFCNFRGGDAVKEGDVGEGGVRLLVTVRRGDDMMGFVVVDRDFADL